jgi:hypothetical protein
MVIMYVRDRSEWETTDRQRMRTKPYVAWVMWVGFYFFIYDWLRKKRSSKPFTGALKNNVSLKV